MEAGNSCFAELGGEIGELGEIGEPACQQLGGFGDHLDLLSHEVLEAEAEDEDEDDRLISLDSGDSSSRQLQGGSQQGHCSPTVKPPASRIQPSGGLQSWRARRARRRRPGR